MPRPCSRTIRSACLVAVVVVGGCRSSALSSPVVTAPASSSAPPAGPPTQFGMSYGDTLTAITDGQLDAELDDAVALGVRWVRTDLVWARVQAANANAFDWAPFDRIVAAASARGLSMLPIIGSTPAWARRSGCTTTWCEPADPATFATFATAAVRHYSAQGVHRWEIWNEPNAAKSWSPMANAADYVKLVAAAAPAMRRQDPQVFLLSGGLASGSGHNDVAQLTFLSQFCALGGNRLVDAVAYHPYSFPVPATDPVAFNAWSKIATTPTSFRSVLKVYGTPDLAIWVTEYGAPTNGPGAVATADDYHIDRHPDHVDEAYQAVMATDVVDAARHTAGVGALFWYSDRDQGTSTATVENFFGLRRFDGSAKPAFAALRSAVTALTG